MNDMEKNMDIPVVILCGGKGTRAGHITEEIPKPLLEVGGKPILWHVMKIYASQGCKRFILCLGYKGSQVREYLKAHNPQGWQITCVDTGVTTLKSKRISRIKNLIKEENFFLAYSDDVADVDLRRLFRFHSKTHATVTITAVKLSSIFGVVNIDGDGLVSEFKEKPLLKKWMNGGFMVMNRRIFGYLDAGELENEVFEKLVAKRDIAAYRHTGQWKTMNTLKDNLELNAIWKEGKAFWKKW